MPVAIQELRAVVTANISDFRKNLGVAARNSVEFRDQFAKAADSLADSFTKITLAATALATATTVAAKRFVEAALQEETALKSLEAVLRATGVAAKITVEQVQEFSAARQAITNFGDEVTIQGAAILATFRRIHHEAFFPALVLAQDLAQLLGTDLQSAVLQIGKALDDPIVGLTALRRSGVSFTQQQLEIIKTLVESNRLFEAQAIILNELQKQVGGVAEAAADPMTQFTNALSDLEEQIGQAILPTFREFADSMMQLVDKNRDRIIQFARSLAEMVSTMIRFAAEHPKVTAFFAALVVLNWTGVITAVKDLTESFILLGKGSIEAYVGLKPLVAQLWAWVTAAGSAIASLFSLSAAAKTTQVSMVLLGPSLTTPAIGFTALAAAVANANVQLRGFIATTAAVRTQMLLTGPVVATNTALIAGQAAAATTTASATGGLAAAIGSVITFLTGPVGIAIVIATVVAGLTALAAWAIRASGAWDAFLRPLRSAWEIIKANLQPAFERLHAALSEELLPTMRELGAHVGRMAADVLILLSEVAANLVTQLVDSGLVAAIASIVAELMKLEAHNFAQTVSILAAFAALLVEMSAVTFASQIRGLNAILSLLNDILRKLEDPRFAFLRGMATGFAGQRGPGASQIPRPPAAGGAPEATSGTTTDAPGPGGTVPPATDPPLFPGASEASPHATGDVDDGLQKKLDALYIEEAQKENDRLDQRVAEEKAIQDQLDEMYIAAAESENQRIEDNYRAHLEAQSQAEQAAADTRKQAWDAAVPAIDSIVANIQQLPQVSPQFEMAFARLKAELDAGSISTEQFDRGVAALRERFGVGTNSAFDLNEQLRDLQNRFAAGQLSASDFAKGLQELTGATEQAIAAAEREAAQKKRNALMRGDFAGAGMNFGQAVKERFQEQMAQFQQGRFDAAVQAMVNGMMGVQGAAQGLRQGFNQFGDQLGDFRDSVQNVTGSMKEGAEKAGEAWAKFSQLMSTRQGQIAGLQNQIGMLRQLLNIDAIRGQRRQAIESQVELLMQRLAELLQAPPPIISAIRTDPSFTDPGLTGDEDEGGSGRGRKHSKPLTVNFHSVFPASAAVQREIVAGIEGELFRSGRRI